MLLLYISANWGLVSYEFMVQRRRGQQGEKAAKPETTVWDSGFSFVATKPLDIFTRRQDIFQPCQR